MREINLNGIDLTVDYEVTPADEDVGLRERIDIHAIYYENVDILKVVLALEYKDIRDIEEEIWDELES